MNAKTDSHPGEVGEVGEVGIGSERREEAE